MLSRSSNQPLCLFLRIYLSFLSPTLLFFKTYRFKHFSLFFFPLSFSFIFFFHFFLLSFSFISFFHHFLLSFSFIFIFYLFSFFLFFFSLSLFFFMFFFLSFFLFSFFIFFSVFSLLYSGLRKAEALKQSVRRKNSSLGGRNEILEKRLLGPITWTNAIGTCVRTNLCMYGN